MHVPETLSHREERLEDESTDEHLSEHRSVTFSSKVEETSVGAHSEGWPAPAHHWDELAVEPGSPARP